MEHSINKSTIDDLAEFIVSINDNMRNYGMTGKSKGDLMKVVYGENYSNVDSALPLGLLEEMNINNNQGWRYVMDYQNGSGGKFTDLINSIAEKNPNVVVYDNAYEEVDNLPILSAMEEYKNSNYMFDFNYDYIDFSVENYIDEQVNQFRTEKNEMKQQYRGYVRDIEYQGFLAIDENDNWLSDYEFDGEEFDRDNLLKVAKKYPQAKEITFHARLMGDSDFGIEDELSPIDDLAMLFDMNKLKSKNMYAKGGLTYGKTDDVYFEVSQKGYIPKKTYGLESFKEFIKKYEDDERYEVDVPIELFTKESFNQYNSEDSKLRFIQGTIKLLGKEDLLKKLTTSKYLTAKEIDKIKNKRIMQNAPEKTTIVKRIVSKQLLEKGGNVNDYFAILTKQLESKYAGVDLYGRFEITRIENGIEITTDEEEVFNEIKEDYAYDIIFAYPTYYQIEIKDSAENIEKLNNSYFGKASWKIIYDRIGLTTDDLQTFDKIIEEDFNDGQILFVFPPMYKLEIGNFEEFSFDEVDSLLGETLDKYNYDIDNKKEDYLYELSKTFSKEDRDILIYSLIKNKWSLPQGIRESVELKLLNRRNKKGYNDYKGDINDNDIIYYNVGIDEGEDIGTRTLEFFDTKAEAQAFMDKFLLSNPNAKLFIDVEKRQAILGKKVIGQKGNVIVNPQEVFSIVEDKIEDFMLYAEQNNQYNNKEFDYLVQNFHSSLRDYMDEVFNDSPTEVESIEEIDFEDEIENFIIYFTSDEEKREELQSLLSDYLYDNDTNEEISGDNQRKQVPTLNFNEDEINDIINRLRKIDIDGEKMQYILEQVGMSDQMLRQLIMTYPLQQIEDFLEEKINVDNDNQYKKGGKVGNVEYAWLIKYEEKDKKGKNYEDILSNEVVITEESNETRKIMKKMKMGETITHNDIDINGYAISYTKVPLPKGKKKDTFGGTFGYENGGEVGEFARGGKLKIGKDDFSFLLKLSDKDLIKRLDLIRQQQVRNGKQYLDAKNKGNDISKIEESAINLSNQENAIIQARLRNNKMANGGSVELANEKYLNSIPLDKKTRILQNIADHYGISEEQAYAEITDIESEALYEYITDQNLKMYVYQMMK